MSRTCSFCQTELTNKILDLGFTPLANAYISNTQLNEPEVYYPLRVYLCHKCFLVQLYNKVEPHLIFSKDYSYVSSLSKTWVQHCQLYATELIPCIQSRSTKRVIEIGSNDGILLGEFSKAGIPVLGIDPAEVSGAIAKKNGIEVVEDFFSKELATSLRQKGISAALLIGNNVLAHVPDINNFFSGIATLLEDDGICTLEVPSVAELVKNNEFDTIYHEHFFYFSLTALNIISNYYGLVIYNVKKLDIHGGSLRIYLQKKQGVTHPVSPEVHRLLKEETSAGIKDTNFYSSLQNNAFAAKKQFWQWVTSQVIQGRTIAAYGAAAKGNTFLNYCGISNDIIVFVADITPQKQGKLMPGSHIPIVNESSIQHLKPDFIIVLPWNFKEEINAKLNFIKSWGGKLVYFIPSFEVVDL